MKLISRPRRPRRTGEWTDAKAVTFIVTLAATRSVTLAARRSGMSRKAAYALKSRDPAFASAWNAALAAGRPAKRQEPVLSLSKGDKVTEVHGVPFSHGQGNSGFAALMPSFAMYSSRSSPRIGAARLPIRRPCPNRRPPCAPAAS